MRTASKLYSFCNIVMKKTPVEVFSDWAKVGKDFGMQLGHKNSVEKMLRFATRGLKQFSFIDAGCGNGWVIRDVSKLVECINATGVDGSLEMIMKAKNVDRHNSYFCRDLLEWKPKDKVDLVHSMEVFYYFKNPLKLITHIYNNWLQFNSRLIIGMDFYSENKASHSWPDKTGVSIMELLPEKTWIEYFKESGFKNVESWRIGKSESWEGTLVVTGNK